MLTLAALVSDWLWLSCSQESIWICSLLHSYYLLMLLSMFLNWHEMSKTLLLCSIMLRILWGFTQPSTALTILVFWKQCEWCMCTWLGRLSTSPTRSRSQQQQWWKAGQTGARGKGAVLHLLCLSILMRLQKTYFETKVRFTCIWFQIKQDLPQWFTTLS